MIITSGTLYIQQISQGEHFRKYKRFFKHKFNNIKSNRIRTILVSTGQIDKQTDTAHTERKDNISMEDMRTS